MTWIKFKDRNADRYDEINRQIKTRCNEAKEPWLNRQCQEIEYLEKRNTREMHSKVK